MDLNRRLPPVNDDRFAMVPKNRIPRSTFITEHSYKTTFDGGYLIPFLCEELLPGDVHQGEVTFFARLNTLLFPLMDHLQLESFFFQVPSRLLWKNFTKMMGEQDSPGDSISYVLPTVTSAAGGFVVGSIYDYFGLPTVGQVTAGKTVTVNSLPLRAYNFIYDQWFRDENIQSTVWTINNNAGDGPDGAFTLLRRNKKPDYFTKALPWPQKGASNAIIPLTGTVGVQGFAVTATTATVAGPPAASKDYYGTVGTPYAAYLSTNSAATLVQMSGTGGQTSQTPMLSVDLSKATPGVSINALRTAFMTQQLLELDARAGTRYTEMLQAHFGVLNPDGRLQRPEYCGGGRSSFQTSAIPQTSGSGITGQTTVAGSLSAQSVVSDKHTFTVRSTEYGYLIGLLWVGADLTYQQGLRRLWTRSTRYDLYDPLFANLGEQAIRNDEIYCTGDTTDAQTFGYAERWAELRWRPSQLTNLFRSTSASNIDEWHAAQQFGSLPTLNSTFIQDTPPFSRILAAGPSANGQQVILDSVIKIKSTRPMPMFSVPGLTGRF